LAIIGAIGAVVAICGCWRLCRLCSACRLRDCALLKNLLLCTGHDTFDEFELVVLVHEAMFDSDKKESLTTIVRVTAGSHFVGTDALEGSVFQQPLHITVEQGTEQLIVDLLTTSNKLLATVRIDIDEIQGETNMKPELVYQMYQKGKGILNPKIKLTMVVSSADDPEQGSGMSAENLKSDISILVRQQLKKAQMHGRQGASSLDVLKDACAGPLDLFQGLAATQTVYVAATGPPISRRWVLGIWRDQRAFEERSYPVQEVGLLKIQSIQADKKRKHIFFITFFDQSRHRQTLTFRMLDRNRDVWVEILHLLVTKAHEQNKQQKKSRSLPHSKVAGHEHTH